MTDSERSYVTDKDVEQLLVAVTLETPTTDQRREFIDLLNGMMEREVRKAQTEATIHSLDLTTWD